MDALVFLLLAVAGGIGAVCRFLLDGVITAWLERTGGSFPWGTTVVNLTGSLLLGLVTGVFVGHCAPEAQLVLGTGFLGGYTTFSAASVETVRLLQDRRLRAGAVQALGTLLATVAMAGLGLWVGSRF